MVKSTKEPHPLIPCLRGGETKSSNRLVDDSFGKEKYKNIESLEWSHEDLECGKFIKIKGFPAEKK